MNDVTALLPPEVRESYRKDVIRRMCGASMPPPLKESLRRFVSARSANGPPVIPGKRAP